MYNSDKISRVIVTGATSCIGTAIVKELLTAGVEVIAVMRSNTSRRETFDSEIAQCDKKLLSVLYYDNSEFDKIQEKADVFINLAWGGTTGQSRNDTDLQKRNVDCFMKSMTHAKKLGCKIYVDAGSQAEYGWQNGPTDELSACEPFTEYGRAKLRCWQLGHKLAKELDITYIHPRIFSVYGETEIQTNVIPYCITQTLKQQPLLLSECNQSWNFLYRMDAARMICKLITYHFQGQTTQQIYNIASPDTRILKDFIFELLNVTSSESKVIFGAIQPARLLSLDPIIAKVLRVLPDFEFTPFSTGIANEFSYLKGFINI